MGRWFNLDWEKESCWNAILEGEYGITGNRFGIDVKLENS